MPQPRAAPAAQDSAGTLLSLQQVPVPSAGPTAGQSTLGQAEISWICSRTFVTTPNLSRSPVQAVAQKSHLLLMSFPPDHELSNKIHRAAPQQTPLTTAPSLLVQMSPLTSAEEWLCVFYSSLLFMIFVCCVFIWCVYVAGAWFSLFLTAFQIICSMVLFTFSSSTKF